MSLENGQEGLSEKEVSKKAMHRYLKEEHSKLSRTSKAGRLGHTWHVAEEARWLVYQESYV